MPNWTLPPNCFQLPLPPPPLRPTAAPNTLVRPFDLAVPGVLPSTSQSAVQAAVLTAAALQCEIAPVSRFERKTLPLCRFYPLGNQVTQQRWPIARNGKILATANQSIGKKKKKKKKNHIYCSTRTTRKNRSHPIGTRYWENHYVGHSFLGGF